MSSRTIVIREWLFRSAPRRFLVGRAESLLLRWRSLYPVKSAQLGDGSLVYFGALTDAVNGIAQKPIPASVLPLFVPEKRSGVRIPLNCEGRYESNSRPKRFGVGHTIDMSNSGISFTTQSQLPVNKKLTLHITWPTRLESGRILELRAKGTVTRAEETKAALKFERLDFLQASR
jgi:hypothetical protein